MHSYQHLKVLSIFLFFSLAFRSFLSTCSPQSPISTINLSSVLDQDSQFNYHQQHQSHGTHDTQDKITSRQNDDNEDNEEDDIVEFSSFSFATPDGLYDNHAKFIGYFRNPFYLSQKVDSNFPIFFSSLSTMDPTASLPIFERIILFNPITFELLQSISDSLVVKPAGFKTSSWDISPHLYLALAFQTQLSSSATYFETPDFTFKFDTNEPNPQQHHNQTHFKEESKTEEKYFPKLNLNSPVTRGLFQSFPRLSHSTRTRTSENVYSTTLFSSLNQHFIGPSLLPYPTSSAHSSIPPIKNIPLNSRFVTWATTIPTLQSFPPISSDQSFAQDYLTLTTTGFFSFILNQTLVDNPNFQSQTIQPIECFLNGIATSLFYPTDPPTTDPIDNSIATFNIPMNLIKIKFTPLLWHSLFPTQIGSLTISCPSIIFLSIASPPVSYLPMYNEIIVLSYDFQHESKLLKSKPLSFPRASYNFIHASALWKFSSLIHPSLYETIIGNSQTISYLPKLNASSIIPPTTKAEEEKQRILIPFSSVQPFLNFTYDEDEFTTLEPTVISTFYFSIDAEIDMPTLNSHKQTDEIYFEAPVEYFTHGSSQSPVYFTISEVLQSPSKTSKTPPLTFHGFLDWKTSRETYAWNIPSQLYAQDFLSQNQHETEMVSKSKRFLVTMHHRLLNPLFAEIHTQIRLVLASLSQHNPPTFSSLNPDQIQQSSFQSSSIPTELFSSAVKSHRTRSYIPTLLSTPSTSSHIKSAFYDIQMLSTTKVRFRLSTTTSSLNFMTLEKIYLSITGRWIFNTTTISDPNHTSYSIHLLCNASPKVSCPSSQVTYISYNVIEILFSPHNSDDKIKQIDFDFPLEYTSFPYLSADNLPYDSNNEANKLLDPVLLTITPQFSSKSFKSASTNLNLINDNFFPFSHPQSFSQHFLFNATSSPHTLLGFPETYSVIGPKSKYLLAIVIAICSLVGIVALVLALVCIARYFSVKSRILSRLRSRHQVRQQEQRHSLLEQTHIEELEGTDGIKYSVVSGSILPPAYDFMEEDSKPITQLESIGLKNNESNRRTGNHSNQRNKSRKNGRSNIDKNQTNPGFFDSLSHLFSSSFGTSQAQNSTVESNDCVMVNESSAFFDEDENEISPSAHSISTNPTPSLDQFQSHSNTLPNPDNLDDCSDHSDNSDIPKRTNNNDQI